MGVAFIWIVDGQPFLQDGVSCARRFSLESNSPLSVLILIHPSSWNFFLYPASTLVP